jgi:hypothetical protein
MQRRLLQRLEEVRPGATMCPGRLSRDCGSSLAETRPDLWALAHAGKVVLSQGGKAVKGEAIKGPFRVRLP